MSRIAASCAPVGSNGISSKNSSSIPCVANAIPPDASRLCLNMLSISENSSISSNAILSAAFLSWSKRFGLCIASIALPSGISEYSSIRLAGRVSVILSLYASVAAMAASLITFCVKPLHAG